MKYYNQLNYGSIAYPAKGYEKATVKTGGCGICCASMIVENLTGKSFPPAASAPYALSNGARVSGGTDMKKLSQCISRDFGLSCFESSDEKSLRSCLESGGMAIALVGGDRKNYKGVFSNSGHYIVVAEAKNNILTVLDPAKYDGKYNVNGRRGKVTVSGNLCFCSLAILLAETRYKSPKFYLFKKQSKALKENDSEMKKYQTLSEIPSWGRGVIEALIKSGALEGTDGKLNLSEDMLRIFVILNRLGKL